MKLLVLLSLLFSLVGTSPLPPTPAVSLEDPHCHCDGYAILIYRNPDGSLMNAAQKAALNQDLSFQWDPTQTTTDELCGPTPQPDCEKDVDCEATSAVTITGLNGVTFNAFGETTLNLACGVFDRNCSDESTTKFGNGGGEILVYQPFPTVVAKLRLWCVCVPCQGEYPNWEEESPPAAYTPRRNVQGLQGFLAGALLAKNIQTRRRRSDSLELETPTLLPVK